MDNQYTQAGTITITEVNTSTKIVKGTFQFTTTNEPSHYPDAVLNNTITDGTFRYQFED
jgi:hypothetical protein